MYCRQQSLHPLIKFSHFLDGTWQLFNMSSLELTQFKWKDKQKISSLIKISYLTGTNFEKLKGQVRRDSWGWASQGLQSGNSLEMLQVKDAEEYIKVPWGKLHRDVFQTWQRELLPQKNIGNKQRTYRSSKKDCFRGNPCCKSPNHWELCKSPLMCHKSFAPVFRRDDNIGCEDRWERITGNVASKCKFQLQSSSWVGCISYLHPKRLGDVLLRTSSFVTPQGGVRIVTTHRRVARETAVRKCRKGCVGSHGHKSLT